MRLAVYAIALNEEKHVKRFLKTAQEADVVVVADTGSTDQTVSMLRAGGATVHEIKISPWRFDDARNTALALVPADIEVCVSLDLDETMAPGWRQLLEQAWTPATTHAEYRHVSAHYSGGKPAAEMIGSQIHLRHGYRWRNLIHETVVPDRIKAKPTRIPGMIRSHFPDVSKSRAQYLPMLEAACAEEPCNSRHAYLLGREYTLVRRWADGEASMVRYLDIGKSHEKLRRAAAMRRIAQCRVGLDDLEGARDWLYRGFAELPMRATLIELADVHRLRKDWPSMYDAATRAVAMADPPGYIGEWRGRSSRLYDLASIAASRTGRHHEALLHAERAAAEDPADKRLAENARALRAWADRVADAQAHEAAGG